MAIHELKHNDAVKKFGEHTPLLVFVFKPGYDTGFEGLVIRECTASGLPSSIHVLLLFAKGIHDTDAKTTSEFIAEMVHGEAEGEGDIWFDIRTNVSQNTVKLLKKISKTNLQ